MSQHNPSTHGTGGQEGGNIGSKIAGVFKEGNHMGEELRGNINSFADNLFQKPSAATGNDAAAANATGGTAHESTGFSKDAKAVGNAIDESVTKK